MQWPKEKGQTDKTMAERERTKRQDNGGKRRTNRQCNGRKKKNKQTRQCRQNTTQKTKEQYEPQYNWA
jgi:hypothetical protein